MAGASSFSGGWTRNVLTGGSWGYIDRTSDQTPDTQIQHHRRSEHVAEKTFRLQTLQEQLEMRQCGEAGHRGGGDRRGQRALQTLHKQVDTGSQSHQSLTLYSPDKKSWPRMRWRRILTVRTEQPLPEAGRSLTTG